MTPEFWDDRYAANPALYGVGPNAFLAAADGFLPREGRALVPGDGQGRNGLWLAGRGLRVLAVDLSSVALAQAAAQARAEGLPYEAQAGDFLALDIPDAAFALCAVCYLHLPPALRPRAHARMATALAPGGVLAIETFAVGQSAHQQSHGSGGPPDPALHYSAEMLREDFSALEIVFLEEIDCVLREGVGHDGLGRVVRGLFRRP